MSLRRIQKSSQSSRRGLHNGVSRLGTLIGAGTRSPTRLQIQVTQGETGAGSRGYDSERRRRDLNTGQLRPLRYGGPGLPFKRCSGRR